MEQVLHGASRHCHIILSMVAIIFSQNLPIEAGKTLPIYVQFIRVNYPASIGQLELGFVSFGVVFPELFQASHKLAHIRCCKREAACLVFVCVQRVRCQIQLEFFHITGLQNISTHTSVKFSLKSLNSFFICLGIFIILAFQLSLLCLIFRHSGIIFARQTFHFSFIGSLIVQVCLHQALILLLCFRIFFHPCLQSGIICLFFCLVILNCLLVFLHLAQVFLICRRGFIYLELGCRILQHRCTFVGTLRPFDRNTAAIEQHRIGVAEMLGIHMTFGFPLIPAVHNPIHHSLIVHMGRRFLDERVVPVKACFLSHQTSIVKVLSRFSLSIAGNAFYNGIICCIQVFIQTLGLAGFSRFNGFNRCFPLEAFRNLRLNRHFHLRSTKHRSGAGIAHHRLIQLIDCIFQFLFACFSIFFQQFQSISQVDNLCFGIRILIDIECDFVHILIRVVEDIPILILKAQLVVSCPFIAGYIFRLFRTLDLCQIERAVLSRRVIFRRFGRFFLILLSLFVCIVLICFIIGINCRQYRTFRIFRILRSICFRRVVFRIFRIIGRIRRSCAVFCICRIAGRSIRRRRTAFLLRCSCIRRGFLRSITAYIDHADGYVAARTGLCFLCKRCDLQHPQTHGQRQEPRKPASEYFRIFHK